MCIFIIAKNFYIEMTVELSQAKKELSGALQGNLQKYLDLLKRWCKQKINKDEFDKHTRSILTEDQFSLHNQFILAILLKSFTPAFINESNPFVADGTYANIYNPTVFDAQCIGNLAPEDVLALSFCPNDIYLPDTPSIRSRISIHCWEQDLEESDHSIGELLYFAMEEFLKNICSFLALKKRGLKRKRNFDVTNREYKYTLPIINPKDKISTFETQIPMMSLRNYTSLPDSVSRITLFDVRDILPLYKSVVYSHTVYARNYERLLAQLWHPS